MKEIPHQAPQVFDDDITRRKLRHEWPKIAVPMSSRFVHQLFGEEVVYTGVANVPMCALLFEQRGDQSLLDFPIKRGQEPPQIVVIAGARPVPSASKQLLLSLQETAQLLGNDLFELIA